MPFVHGVLCDVKSWLIKGLHYLIMVNDGCRAQALRHQCVFAAAAPCLFCARKTHRLKVLQKTRANCGPFGLQILTTDAAAFAVAGASNIEAT